jgi:hypothetical protein
MQGRQTDFRFGALAVPGGFAVSDDGRTLTRTGAEGPYLAALAEPDFDSAGRTYAELEVFPAGADRCYAFLGVTALPAPPGGGGRWAELSSDPATRAFYCLNGCAMPGERPFGAELARGDRVGLLVAAGRLTVFVNGARVGPGPMAEDVPPRVRLAAELYHPGAHVRIVPGAVAPDNA